MHQIIRNLLVFALISATAQSGMAQWKPHFGADKFHGKEVHSSFSHQNYPRLGTLPDSNSISNGIETPPGEVPERRCVQPTVGCDCPDCLGYFDAHARTLPIADGVPLEIPEPGARNESTIASLASINHSPPTPPPRS